MTFQINGTSPPTGEDPKQSGYIHRPATVGGVDGLGRPQYATEDPWIEVAIPRLNKAGWDWYNSFFSAGEVSAHLTSVQIFDFYDYDVPEGPDWVVYSGSYIYMSRPIYGAIDFGHYFNVTFAIRGLA